MDDEWGHELAGGRAEEEASTLPGRTCLEYWLLFSVILPIPSFLKAC